MSGHIAERPTWDCKACEKAWPCDPAREALVVELDSAQLAMYMWANLEEAAGDMPTMTAPEAFERFLAWARPTGRA